MTSSLADTKFFQNTVGLFGEVTFLNNHHSVCSLFVAPPGLLHALAALGVLEAWA